MTRVVCRSCRSPRYVKVMARDCPGCGSVSWAWPDELDERVLPSDVLAMLSPDDATFALADALGDAGRLGRVVDACVRLVLAMEILESAERDALAELVDAVSPPDAWRASA